MNLHALWVAVAIGGIAMAFTTPVLPQTVLGWGGMVGAALAYVVAFICFFSAIAMIGSVHTVVLSNIEPLWAILFAAWLWHEPLGAARMAGAGLVLASVLWVSRPQRRTGG
jgi:drug/metabolite transporter (DMT)-like permease